MGVNPLRNFYNEMRVVQRTAVIEQKSVYGLSNIRDVWFGDVTAADGEFMLVAAANGAQDARLDTAERGPYPPGQEVEPGLAFRSVQKPTGGQKARWGYFDDQDGWFFELDADGLNIVSRRLGVDDSRRWGVWDGDKIKQSGFGRSFSFKPSDGYVYQIPFTWYGYGPIQYNFQVQKDLNDTGWIKHLETRRPVGGTSAANPHLPLRCEAVTQAGDDAFEVRVSGRQVSVVGPYDPIFRQTSVENTVSVGTDAWVPALAVRRKSVQPYALTQLAEVTALSADAFRIAVVEGIDLSGSVNWEDVTDYDADETLLEQNLSPGAITLTDGNLLAKFRASGGSGGNKIAGSTVSVVRAPLIEDRTMVVFLRKVAGGGTSDVSMTAIFNEEY